MKHSLMILVLTPWAMLAEDRGVSNVVAIPWAEMGTHVKPNAAAAGVKVVAEDQVQLLCEYQKLAGEVTRQGLLLTDLADSQKEKAWVRVAASHLGRAGLAGVELVGEGVVEKQSKGVRWVRPGLIEEFSTSVDGVRQDFVVSERPPGAGHLRLEIGLQGAVAETAAQGVVLRLAGSQRTLAYSKLKVVDAMQRQVDAWLTAPHPDQLRIEVDDRLAAYPLRIDPTFSDANWISMGGVSGVNGSVHAVVGDSQGSIYIAGDFQFVGTQTASNIAKWDGTAWQPLGAGLADGVVYAMTLDAAGNLYAGGSFITVGTQSGRYLARWDGVAWSHWGLDFDNVVYALAATGNTVYAGGQFSQVGALDASKVARWSGGAWQALGEGVDGTVFALAVSTTGQLFAGGSFANAGGQPASRVARWDGTAWSGLGAGTDGNVLALAMSSDGSVFVGGEFEQAGGVARTGIARWDGSAWQSLGSGVEGAVTCLAAVAGGGVHAGGLFNAAGGQPAVGVALWNGSTWSTLGGGVGGFPSSLFVQSTGALVVGGTFAEAGGVGARGVARWDGTVWTAMAQGLNDRVNAVVADDQGHVYIGGRFLRVGEVAASRVARWDGTSWTALGVGVNGEVLALALDSEGRLYAGGLFSQAGGAAASRVARWNGSAWQALGSGFDATVRTLLVDATDQVFAGGDFLASGATSMARVGRWTGSAWTALGAGCNGAVNALVSDAQGAVFAGGLFSTAGGQPAAAVARWQGGAWQGLGQGCNGPVNALALDSDGLLYAGGGFSEAGGTAAARVARWDGSNWSALGAGCNNTVFALHCDTEKRLYAGGQFSQAGGQQALRIARWLGTAWEPLGSGTSDTVRAFSLAGPVELYCGGDFTLAGAKPSGYLARVQIGLSSGPELQVLHPPGTLLQSGVSSLPFAPVVVGQSGAPLTITLRNNGSDALTGISVAMQDGAHSADFDLDAEALANTLTSEQVTTFTVTFSPTGVGARQAVLEIRSSDPDVPLFTLALTGVGQPPPTVLFSQQPASQLVPVGQPVQFQAAVTGDAPITHQWFKGSSRVQGATALSLNLPAARPALARVYQVRSTNALGTTASRPAYLGVFTAPPSQVAIRDGGNLVLTCQVTVPAGVSLSYLWKRDTNPLSNGPRITGATGKSLRLVGIQPGEAGTYSCTIAMTTPHEVVAAELEVQVGVEALPVVNPLMLPDTLVNEPVQRSVTIANAPGRLRATGLPPGVTLNPVTGVLSGRPTRARLVRGLPAPYAVTFQASNLAGSGPPLVVNWTILPLPVAATGEFNGLIDRNVALNGPSTDAEEGLGGQLRVLTTSAAGISGSLRQGKVTSTFKGLLDPPVGGGTIFTGTWTLTRKGLPALTLDLELDSATGALMGTVSDGSATAALEAWRATPSGSATGTWHVALVPDAALAGEPDYPEGDGHAILKIDAKGGAVWSGRLSEGTAITGSSTLGPAGQVPFFMAPYGLTGSVLGWVEIAGQELDGSLSWWKAPQAASVKTSSYKAGIPLHVVDAVGGAFVPPGPGETLLNWSQARLTFSLAGLTSPLEREFAVTSANQALLDPGTDTITLSLNARTGLLTCGFTLAAEPGRRATGQALVVPRLDRAVGAFNWPASGASGAPLKSGRVRAEALP